MAQKTMVLWGVPIPNLADQISFCGEGKGLVNCIYKLCPTGMQLARWRNQISNNTLLKYLLRVHTLSQTDSQSVFTAPVVAEKMC